MLSRTMLAVRIRLCRSHILDDGWTEQQVREAVLRDNWTQADIERELRRSAEFRSQKRLARRVHAAILVPPSRKRIGRSRACR